MTGRFILIGSLIQGILCGFSIRLPEKIEVLSGSCAFIPCTFEIDPQYNRYLTDSVKRLWYKDGYKVFDPSSWDRRLLSGSIFGEATDKNCTTRFDVITQYDEGYYSFRLEGYNYLRYTYSKQVQIDVIDSPPKPTVSLYKEQVEVVEGSSVHLRCSAQILCSPHPPALTWSSSTQHSIREQRHQNQTHLISDLNFTVTRGQDTENFTCTVSYQLQQRRTAAQETLMLRVQYAPKHTSVFVSPSGSVLEGQSVTLSCSSDANPPVINFSWSRLTEEQLERLTDGPHLTVNNSNPTHIWSYYCNAQNKHGAQDSNRILLNVTYAPKISNSSCSRSDAVTSCFCEIHGNPVPALEWRLSGDPVGNSTSTSILQERFRNTGFRTTLTVRQSLTDTPTLQCVGGNVRGTASQQFQLQPPQDPSRLHSFSLLAGAVIGASVVTIFCIASLICVRRGNCKQSQTRQEDSKGLVLNEDAVFLGDQGPFGYASEAEAVTLKTSDSLHYCSIDFIKAEAASGEIRGVSSLTSEYAAVRHRSETHNISAAATGPKTDQSTSDRKSRAREGSQPSEDTTYENFSHR